MAPYNDRLNPQPIADTDEELFHNPKVAMIIKKLRLQNFKKFQDRTFEFNDDINIVVGDNESGKSSLLEAIEVVLNGCYRGKPLRSELTTELFNNECIKAYLSGNKSQETLPEILVEAYLDGGPKNLKGDNNSEKQDTKGLFVRIFFDPELANAYASFIENPDSVLTLPVEMYTFEWFSFAWNRVNQHNKGINCLFVDASRLHPTYGRTQYINGIISAALEKNDRTTLNLNYRQLKAKFDEEDAVKAINDNLDTANEITKKSLKVTADIASTTSWESSLQLAVDDVSFNQIGKGEQNQIQIKLALKNKAQDMDVIMVEEPENHLSHINLVQLISSIEKKNQGKQIFLTTHSSYVLNKLSINKLCLLAGAYTRFKELDAKTVKTLKRFPGHDTLRVILAQKVILVEGPSDELVLKKIYLDKYGFLPEENGIDIIVVRGIGFKNYLNIAKPIKHPVRIVKDNDGDYQKNITKWLEDYEDDTISVFSPEGSSSYSLEPAIIESNSDNVVKLDKLAGIMLSPQTYKKYNTGDLQTKKEFLKDWFKGEKTGGRKVDSAMRIFENNEEITFPDYLLDAVNFDE